MPREWTVEDQRISDKKLYFVVTIYVPWDEKKRPIKHCWGPGTYDEAQRRKREVDKDIKTDSRSEQGAVFVGVIRWRGNI